jgi:hypothetical protein
MIPDQYFGWSRVGRGYLSKSLSQKKKKKKLEFYSGDNESDVKMETAGGIESVSDDMKSMEY